MRSCIQISRLTGKTSRTDSSRVQPHVVPRFSSGQIAFHRISQRRESVSLPPPSLLQSSHTHATSELQRISRITSSLKLDLSQLLTSILSSPPSTPESHQEWLNELSSALQTFSSLHLIHEAEEIVRKTVVKPFLVQTINRDALNNQNDSSLPELPSGESTDETIPPAYRLAPLAPPVSFKENDSGPLLRLYNVLLRFISEDCGNILCIAERSLSPGSTALTNGGMSSRQLAIENRRKREEGTEENGEEREVEGFEILTKVIVDEIATRLVSELGTVVFAAGRPSVFHQVSSRP